MLLTALPRRWRSFILVSFLFLFALWMLVRRDPTLVDRYRPQRPVPAAPPPKLPPPPPPSGPDAEADARLRLVKLPDRYPVRAFKELPRPGGNVALPPIQKTPAPGETTGQRRQRLARRAAVKAAFVRSWEGYKANAWLADELAPVSGAPRQDYEKLSGWAATLVDTLDTLWIMDLRDEFRMAVQAVAEAVDFTRSDAPTVHLFETTIRYLGGLLGAYEVSDKAHPALLRQATQLGDILMGAFDTPNRLPLARWDWRAYVRGGRQTSAPRAVLAAELGTLSLEFTKLSQLTGDVRYYDAVQRIADVLDAHQKRTRLPGMWPVVVDAATPAFDTDATFTLNGKADSLFEYLPKQWLLLGGALEQPRRMYAQFLTVAKKHLFRRVLNPGNQRLVLPGEIRVADDPLAGRTVTTLPRAEHLGCFAGGMVALAARAFAPAGAGDKVNVHNDADLDLAAQLTDACVWAYNATATGVGPEKFHFAACGTYLDPQDGLRCAYGDDKWRDAIKAHWQTATPETSSIDRFPLYRDTVAASGADTAVAKLMAETRLPRGMVDVDNAHYLLRPEAIESVFVLWRLTGDRAWQEKAWHMFASVARHSGALPRGWAAALAPAVAAGDAADGGGGGAAGGLAALLAPLALDDDGKADYAGAAAVDDVTRAAPSTSMDRMESFWLAETLKYFYLIFDDWNVLSLDDWVFNTEAHPFRRADFSDMD